MDGRGRSGVPCAAGGVLRGALAAAAAGDSVHPERRGIPSRRAGEAGTDPAQRASRPRGVRDDGHAVHAADDCSAAPRRRTWPVRGDRPCAADLGRPVCRDLPAVHDPFI